MDVIEKILTRFLQSRTLIEDDGFKIRITFPGQKDARKRLYILDRLGTFRTITPQSVKTGKPQDWDSSLPSIGTFEYKTVQEVMVVRAPALHIAEKNFDLFCLVQLPPQPDFISVYRVENGMALKQHMTVEEQRKRPRVNGIFTVQRTEEGLFKVHSVKKLSCLFQDFPTLIAHATIVANQCFPTEEIVYLMGDYFIELVCHNQG